MRERILSLLCKPISMMGDTYTIGGIIVTILGTFMFMALLGLVESI